MIFCGRGDRDIIANFLVARFTISLKTISRSDFP
ncbi:hypothetical protein YPPY66_4940, partial [Yersinia pestis PY-66]